MKVTLRRYFVPVAVVLFFNGAWLAERPMAAANDVSPARPASAAKITVDLTQFATAPTLQPEVFGINWNWMDAGGGVVEFGEMVRDRSFRNQGEPAKRRWVESPNPETLGRINAVRSGGHGQPWGGKAYPGYVALSQLAPGYTCVSQQMLEVLAAGARYELHVSARGEKGRPALSVFFADQGLLPIEKLDKPTPVTSNTWADYKFMLKPEKDQAPGYLRICIVTPGEVGIDEVRLSRVGGTPRVRALANTRIRELGVRSLRWPSGSDADYFDWREALGPLRERGENPSAFGDLQTPTLGLHEFLDYCEATGIVPLITVNVRESPQSAAELVEYILGSKFSLMGALRARNGRAEPWAVTHFELGNEPVDVYRGTYGKSETARGYVRLASSISSSMRAKANELSRKIELKGILETTFAIADWIKAVPMLQKWNAVVLDRETGLRRHVDQFKGHFYSAFNWRSSERELFEEVMGGGATLAATLRKLNREYGPLPRFWLTEYSVLVQKKKRVGADEILLKHGKDFQAGLATADLLMTAIQENFGGAYLFNLAEWGTWGVLANPLDFRLRPSGLAFSMLSKMAGERLLPVTVEAGSAVTVKGGDGNNPSRMQYSTLTAIASQGSGAVQVLILNRSYNQEERLRIVLKGSIPKRAEIYQLGPEKLTATNDDRAGTVQIKHAVSAARDFEVINVPPRSLTRVVFSGE